MKKLYRRSISGLLALLICFTAILGSGMTAYAAAFTGETADSYSVAFPRDATPIWITAALGATTSCTT